jgi:hypothetical protein
MLLDLSAALLEYIAFKDDDFADTIFGRDRREGVQYYPYGGPKEGEGFQSAIRRQINCTVYLFTKST